MAIELIVTEPFAYAGTRYRKGAVIDDPAVISAVETEFARHFVRRSQREALPAAEAPSSRRAAK